MENDTMPAPGANVLRRPAIGGGRAEKEQPAPPSDAASTQAPRPATPNGSGHRGAQRPHKTPSKSATVDPSMSPVNATKQPVQPSAPPAPSAPSAPSALPTPSAPPSLPPLPVSGQRTPLEEWVAVPQPNAIVEELQTKIAELKAAIKQKDAKIKDYKDDLKDRVDAAAYYKNKSDNLESQPYRQEVLSIRRHLQVDELCEPWEINKKFGEIVRKVEDISRDMGEALGELQPIGPHTTVDLLKLISKAPEGQHLAAATPTADLDIEDFIDFGCRALINGALFNEILSTMIFHPGLGPEDNAHFCDMYHQIRRTEPQVVAGRWRISTLKLHAGCRYSPQERALRLCQDTLLPFCSKVIDPKSCHELIQSMVARFEELFKRAYDWNHLAKSSVIMLDFHPHFQLPGTPFETHNTLLEGRKPKPPSSNAILLTSKLGLWSSCAVGGGKEPEYSFQTKATMLAAEYFA